MDSTTTIQDLEAAEKLLIQALWKCHPNNEKMIENLVIDLQAVLKVI